MKRCPTCQSTYTDDSLRFCLQDGAQLVSASDEPPPTEILDARVMPTVRLPTPAQTETIRPRATQLGSQQNIAPSSKRSSPALTATIIAIAALLISVGLGLTLWLRSSDGSNRNAAAGESNRQANTTSGQKETEPVRNIERASTAPGRITATASSTRPPLAGNTYDAGNVLDGRLMTAWMEGADGPGLGEWIRCDFEREVTLKRLSIAPGYFKSPQIWARNNRVAAATISFSDGSSRQLRFDDRMEEQLLELGAIRTSWVRLTINEVYAGTDPDTAISQLAFESEP